MADTIRYPWQDDPIQNCKESWYKPESEDDYQSRKWAEARRQIWNNVNSDEIINPKS